MFQPGDKVTVIHGDTANDPVIGRTGTVYAVDEAADQLQPANGS